MKRQKRLFYLARDAGATGAFLAISLARISHAFRGVPNMEGRPVVVLGNGPSSEQSVRQLMKVRDWVTVVCVNDFYRSESFQELRPEFYVIADPHYWIRETQEWHALPLVAGFANVTWPMHFFMPTEAASFIEEGLSSNKNISLHAYNRMPAWGFTWARHLSYRLGLGMPRPQNVMVAALFLALKGGAKTIYLGGAEHLWHESIKLSDENMLFVSHGSTGEQGSPLVPFYKVLGGEIWTVPDIFEAWSAVHRSYHDIAKWAKALGATIENFTPTTFIDAFARTNLEAITQRLESGAGAAGVPASAKVVPS